jgi:hypothetical protein
VPSIPLHYTLIEQLNFDTALRNKHGRELFGGKKSAGCVVFVFSYLIFCRKTDKEGKMERWLKSDSLKQSKDNVNPLIDLNQDDAATEETEPLLQQSASTSS